MATNLEVYRVTTILGYCTFGQQAVNDAQNVLGNVACGKDHNQENLSEMIMLYHNIYNMYNQITSDVCKIPIILLTTDSLQLMLINVLITIHQFLNT